MSPSFNDKSDQPTTPSPPQAPVPAEVVERALREFDDEATAEEVRKLRESGGLTLGEFYGELEWLVRSPE